MGSRRLYDFVHDNPMIEFHPSDYTNDPFIIGRNEKMVAINGALEVDLTGQVCADSLGYYLYSGIGGHADFIRGAARSRGGKAVIALPSTTSDGRISRIVPHISEGAGVVTTRGDVHYVVTEYGIAYLHGKTIRERALALINIAHPKFREQLLEAAKAHNYVYADQTLPLTPEDLLPGELEKPLTLATGERLLLRPVKPTDERSLQELFYSLRDTDVYMRFHALRAAFPRRYVQSLMHFDYRREMVIVAVSGAVGAEKVLGIGRYVLQEGTQMAEIDFTVHRQWQGKGIGTALFNYLIEVAKRSGVKG
ncbi:MAG: GNAT family N-acetyltransferase, partial [Clostridia bacterium]|nr:GNAT family N-acetyltransferase [Clostridia bacterium]